MSFTWAHPLATTIVTSCLAAAWVCGPAGCAVAPTADSDSASTSSLRPAGPLSAAASTENGLEVQRVVLRDEDERVGAALLEAGEPFGGPEAAALERNGFLLIRVDASRIDAVLADLAPPLAPPLTQVSTWHGQAPNWREVVRRPARDPVAAVVDGRPRVFSDGSLLTQLRAWTVPMEDRAMLELQLRQEFQPVDRGVRLMLDPSTDANRGEALGPTVELLLGGEDTWILTCHLPRDPVREDPDAPATEPSGGKGPVPDDIFGPSASLPPTLAALFFSSETPATRTLLIFLPRLPSVSTSDRPELVKGPDGGPEGGTAGALGSAVDGETAGPGLGSEMQPGQLGPNQGAAPPAPAAADSGDRAGLPAATPAPAPTRERREGGAFGGGS